MSKTKKRIAMLDISILNADKATTTDKKLQEFLSKEYIVTEKFDGTKLTLWRNNEPWNKDYTKNWVVAFKNQILFKEEFDDIDRVDIKNYSVGISQYALIHDHLEANHIQTKDFPLNTEVFIEFIQNKLTTTRDYHQKFDLFLIAYSPATAEIVGGMIKTNPTEFSTKNNLEYSNLLGIALPPVVFQGKIDTLGNFEMGIKSWGLMAQWETHKHKFIDAPHSLIDYETIKAVFLGFESCLGGKTEGVVLEAEDALYKFVQADQYSKSVRFARKVPYQGTPEVETQYWSDVNKVAHEYLIHSDYQKPLEVLLKDLNNKVFISGHEYISEVFAEKIKATETIRPCIVKHKAKDDIFLTAKQMILDRLPENQNALFVGKFRIPTKAHINIIEEALKIYPHVVVCIVKAKKDVKESLSLELQTNILTSIFGDSITIITHSTGNLTSIINKSPKRLRFILAGSDRIDSYEAQLKRHSSLAVVETIRKELAENEISATRAIMSIKSGDLATFKNLVTAKTYNYLSNIQEEFQK
ncbi:MAG: hypothetical protein DRH57_04650 [Candidatus Cloacimonadota bacterium]|nr:MAG: hypothetical protein DRH57_04650 [Candidatus Cloacimonadota bacterium]